MLRRTLVTMGAALMALMLSAAPALAHECYNASRSDNGNAHAAAGQALSSFDELLADLCPAGDALVLDAVDTTDFDTDGVLVNVNTVMGGGALAQGHKTTDGHDIDYLPAPVTAAIGQAFGACFGG
jgi:hypothetical protein